MGIYDLTATLLDGTPKQLSDYRGKVLLIVNVASGCGLTPQYAGLEALYRRHQDKGLVVLGFPSNQFAQETGDAAQIQDFCTRNYGVSFPLFDKVEVNGANTHPLFAYLKAQLPGFLGSQDVKWNFTKFLVDWNGTPRRRYGPVEMPELIEGDIVAMLRDCPAPEQPTAEASAPGGR
ncbi:MAG: glutathione peroxidase [Chloroflexales bacterium]